jgi:hypothetical protein
MWGGLLGRHLAAMTALTVGPECVTARRRRRCLEAPYGKLLTVEGLVILLVLVATPGAIVVRRIRVP